MSTNIAETSLTVDGILYVIDTGYVKMKVRWVAAVDGNEEAVMAAWRRTTGHRSQVTFYVKTILLQGGPFGRYKPVRRLGMDAGPPLCAHAHPWAQAHSSVVAVRGTVRVAS